MSCAEYDRFAEFYDHVTIYRNRPDVDFFVDLAGRAEGDVLEVGCGTGRVLLPCARAGATIVGLDRSAGMLAIARAHLDAEPPDVQARVTLVEGDMRDLDMGRTFALITLPFRSFQHLMTPDDQQVTLRRLRAHLAPGGRLVLDLFNPSIPFLGDERFTIAPMQEPPFTMPDGRRVVRSYRITARDFPAQSQEVEFTMAVTHPDGREEQHIERFWIRYTFRYELEYLLRCEGFAVEAIYGDYDRSPFATTYPGEIIAVARVA
jgi:SAM-dependent methyltransferase